MTNAPPAIPSDDPADASASGETTALRVHETIEGHGAAYDGERLIAAVDYSIKDVEETPQTALFRGGTAAVRNIYGLVKSPQVKVLAEYVGARLALRLEDGRVLHFTVAKMIGTGACLIQGLGGFR